MKTLTLSFALCFALSYTAICAPKTVNPRHDLPMGGNLSPKMQEPVFAVVSKQGMRIFTSRDDGKTWKQTFLASDERGDNGWHGAWAVYGMTYTNGVIGAFSGWGSPGEYIGSDDGENWVRLNKEKKKLASVWSAAAGKGVILTAADQWRGMSSSADNGATWQKHSTKKLLNGDGTHHMMCGYGDYKDGAFVIIGDKSQVFYSHDLAKTWKRTKLPKLYKVGQSQPVYGNGVFLSVINRTGELVRSDDGGATWTVHSHGMKGDTCFNGVSFINGEFWITSKRHSGKKSKDGIHWEDLPASHPKGYFVKAESGTIINVETNKNTIKRSTDGGKTWKTVFTTHGKGAGYSLSFAVYGKVNKVKK
ncbi:MAG: glycoside hydrolase [Lentisphaerales bacterium]|nr:glycoside hydrolase [Lentisphaerales bacterium]